MKALSIILAILVLALVGVTLAPELQEYHFHATLAAMAAAALLLLIIAISPFGRAAARREPEPAKAQAAAPAAVPPQHQAEAEVVSFLATLQEKGRFIDFLMDDVGAYGDAQVGAAARVVHEGCKSVLHEHFDIAPVRPESEGSKITVPENYRADEYRLVGKISGKSPFTGYLVHRGWRANAVKLPRVLRAEEDRLPTIAPAEVELR